MTYDQICELVNMEFKNNDEDLRKTAKATGLPMSIVMEATGIKDMLDFAMDNDGDEDDWDINGHDDVPDDNANVAT
mgnify:FL=1